MSTPDKIRSNIINLQVDVTRYEAGLRAEIDAMVTRVGREVTRELLAAGLDTPRTDWQRARLRALITEAQRTIEDGYKEIAQTHADEMSGLVQVSSSGITTAINSALGANLMVPPKWTSQQLEALASEVMIQGAPSAEWWSRQSSDLLQNFTDQMRTGMLRGESISELRDRIMGGKTDLRTIPAQDRGPIWTARRNAEALVRTSAITVNNAAHEAAYEANADIMAGVQWCATLDPRTCPSCGALDGREWAMGEPHPSPALHFCCRCVLCPKTKSFEQLAREAHVNSRIAKELDKMPIGTRASMGGQVSGNLTYEEWFKDQPVARQKDILGEGKWDIWSRGKLGFSDMVDQRGNVLTLAQLRSRYG